jgi:hypothetical protein
MWSIMGLGLLIISALSGFGMGRSISLEGIYIRYVLIAICFTNHYLSRMYAFMREEKPIFCANCRKEMTIGTIYGGSLICRECYHKEKDKENRK